MTMFSGRFADSYRPTFGRSLHSELMKLNTRSIQVTAAIGIILYGLIMWMLASSEYVEADPLVVTAGWPSMTIFFIVIGTVAVTSEYSHNTMRTTVLADPRRGRSFTAKLTAVTIVSLLLSATLIAIGYTLTRILKDGFNPGGEVIAAYSIFCIIMVSIGVLSAAMGYLVRSTAGAISIMIGFMYLIDLVQIIPQEFFRKTVSQLIPSALGSVAISDQPLGDLITGRWVALAVFVGYAVVGVVGALIAFKKRDI